MSDMCAQNVRPTPEPSADGVRCAGSGQYPAEQVILDTAPFMNPSGTCRACGQRMTLTPYRLPEHSDGGVCGTDPHITP